MKIDEKYIQKIWENKKVRQSLAFKHPLWFSLFYLRHHFTYPLAPFHLEMFHLIKHQEYEFIVMMAFRGSGKSTIMNMSNVLWSILGKPQKKFVIIISKTQEQAKNHFANIKSELENNKELKEDFGPFKESQDAWNRLSLELEYHGAKIISATRDQSIRGLRYRQFRPDLIILDEAEDTDLTADNNIDGKAFLQKFQDEIIPLGSNNTRIVVLGNLISKDSFMMRLKEIIEKNKNNGIFRAYPLLDDNYENLWPDKFSDIEIIEKIRAKLSNQTWAREYLLRLDGPDTPDDIKDELSELTVDSELVKLSHQYENELCDSRVQLPLIKQMKKFSISAPKIEPDPEIIIQSDDLRYPIYQKYLEVSKKISDELAASLRKLLDERRKKSSEGLIRH
ncbi:MAG: hypothetical protein WC499_01875 [Patescibacteria group bacterium]